jgi:hypothetical protein
VAEELDPALGEPEPVVAPVEGDGDPNADTEPLTLEALAAEKGWVPKDQFRGDPEQWRSADEFIRVGLDSSRNMSRELKNVRDEVSRISRTSAQLLEDKIAERDEYWKQQHARAVEEGDVAAAERASEARSKLKSATPAADGPSPDLADFIERNKGWFQVDPLATARAVEITDKLSHLPHTEQLKQAERAIKKEFPELFPAPAKRPAAVQTGQSRNAAPSNRQRGFNDMPAASQEMAKDMLRRHGIPLEKTAASFWADASNSERKVG